jgi:hypothetical protein
MKITHDLLIVLPPSQATARRAVLVVDIQSLPSPKAFKLPTIDAGCYSAAPKGRNILAQGFNPGFRALKGCALKGHQTGFVTLNRRPKAEPGPDLAPLSGRI